MSRYHPVRPKKHKHKHAHSAPRPAAPAQSPMPSEAQMEQVARDRLEAAFAEIYKLHNGHELDASIARWKRMLALFDREMAQAEAEDGSKQHRWTVSPSIAFRANHYLDELLERQTQLQAECWAEAKKILQQFVEKYGAVPDSLCPPKYPEPAPQAHPQPQHPTQQEVAQGPPIAA